MEDEGNMNTTGTQDGFMVNPLDHKRLMTQRLKNRERQRRYRARKRLEALRNAAVTNQSSSVQEVELNDSHTNYVARVHCKRKWKKDARRAHASKNSVDATNAIESHTLCSAAGTMAEPSVAVLNGEPNKPKLGRRDWKAEARNKKN